MKRFNIIGLIIVLILGLGIARYVWPVQPIVIDNASSVSQVFERDNNLNISKKDKAAALINLETNQVLYQKEINKPLPVYSVSKLMFLASASKQLKSNETSFETVVTIGDQAGKLNKNRMFSSAHLKKGAKYTIKELYEATMIPSGNDATVELADYVFGSHQKAVAAMNTNAKAWGMSKSSFVTTSGLDGDFHAKAGIKSEKGSNLMSVSDTILLLERIKEYYPEIIKAGSKTQSVIGEDNLLENTNPLMGKYQGVYGLKTGSNAEDYSYNMVSLYKGKHNQDLAAIIYNAQTKEDLAKDTKGLFEYSKTLEITNLKDNLHLDVNFIYAKKNPKLSLSDNFYVYHTKNSGFKYELTNYSSKYNKYLNAFTYGKQGSRVGSLKILNINNFFMNKPKNLGYVIIKDDVLEVNKVEMVYNFLKSLIKK